MKGSVKNMKKFMKTIIGDIAFVIGVLVALPVALAYGIYCKMKGMSKDQFMNNMYKFFD